MKKILFLLCFAWMAMLLFVHAARSEDALDHWYLRDASGITRVRFLGGRFIGVGTNGLCMTSLDGKTWIKGSSGTKSNLFAVTALSILNPPFTTSYLYVAGGDMGVIVASSDGTDWTQIPANIGTGVLDLVSTGSRLIAGTLGNSMFSSADGTNWARITLPHSYPLEIGVTAGALYAAGSLVIAGAGDGFSNDIWRSLNGGTTWEKVGFADQEGKGIAYGNGRYLLVGYEGWPHVATNTLGTNWFAVMDTNTFVNASVPGRPYVGSDIAFGNGTFVISPVAYGLPKSQGLITTTNGLVWKRRSVFKDLWMNSVTYGNGTFVAAGDSGIYQSEPVVTPVLSSSPRPGTNVVDLEISGAIGTTYRLQSSTNFQDWIDRWTFTSVWLSTNFSDIVDTNQPKTFYRVVSP